MKLTTFAAAGALLATASAAASLPRATPAPHLVARQDDPQDPSGSSLYVRLTFRRAPYGSDLSLRRRSVSRSSPKSCRPTRRRCRRRRRSSPPSRRRPGHSLLAKSACCATCAERCRGRVASAGLLEHSATCGALWLPACLTCSSLESAQDSSCVFLSRPRTKPGGQKACHGSAPATQSAVAVGPLMSLLRHNSDC